MTLKQLRMSKGLSQEECAKYLGISTRTYQNYESKPEKMNSDKYKVIYQKVEAYDQEASVPVIPLPCLLSHKCSQVYPFDKLHREHSS